MKKLLLVFVLIASFCIITLTAINWRDEPLNPKVADYLTPLPKTVLTENNAAYLILGFTAKQDQDPVAAAQQTLQEYDAALADPDKHYQANFDYFSIADKQNLLCDFKEADCLTSVVKNVEAILAIGAQYPAYQARYQALLQRPNYERLIKPSLVEPNPYPNFSVILQMQRIKLSGLLVEASPNAMDALYQDIQFWRMILSNASSLITKMVATRALSNDYHVVQYLAKNVPDVVDDRFKAPLTAQEKDMKPVLESDFKLFTNLILWMDQNHLFAMNGGEWSFLENLAGRFFFKKNATINMLYDQLERKRVAFDKGPETFKAEHERQAIEIEQTTGGFNLIYNPMGKKLVGIAALDSRYSDRILALDALIKEI